jgi:hypothetical protein
MADPVSFRLLTPLSDPAREPFVRAVCHLLLVFRFDVGSLVESNSRNFP